MYTEGRFFSLAELFLTKWSSVCNEVYSYWVLFPLFISIMKSLSARWFSSAETPRLPWNKAVTKARCLAAVCRYRKFSLVCVEWILSGGAAVCTCRCLCVCVGVCTHYLRLESTWLCVSAPPGALRQLFVWLRWAACSEIHTYANVWSSSQRPRAPRAAQNVKISLFLSTSLFTPMLFVDSSSFCHCLKRLAN